MTHFAETHFADLVLRNLFAFFLQKSSAENRERGALQEGYYALGSISTALSSPGRSAGSFPEQRLVFEATMHELLLNKQGRDSSAL